ncbi:MAG: ABC transporter permease subunit, partial [Chloroflexota bacterium]
DFLLLSLLTLLLGLGMLSVGFLISSASPQTSAALGIAVALWLVFVILGDLGIMGSSLVMSFQADTLLTVTLTNPLDTYKILSVDLLNASTEVLGPAGIYAADRFGGRLAMILLLIEFVWIVVPFLLGGLLFRRMDYQ